MKNGEERPLWVSIMKVIWKTLVLAGIVAIILILLLCVVPNIKKCCACNENKNIKQTVLTLRSEPVFDSIANKKGTHIWIDTLTVGQNGNSSTTVWNDCPEKVKKPAVARKTITKKVTENVPVVDSVPVVKEVPVKRDTIPPTVDKPDTLKLTVEKVTSDSTSLLLSRMDVLPMKYEGGVGHKTEFNYQVVPDLHIKEYWKKARTHLIIGTSVATLGAAAYTATWFTPGGVPTFVHDNGLGYFDPANRYYDRNVHERHRLNTLKWERGISVGVTILGGMEIVHGILLLRNADVSVGPQTIKLKYTF